MIEIPVIDAPDQSFSVIIGNRRCSFRLRYNQSVDRWAFDLAIDDTFVLHGRRIVLGRDLLENVGGNLGRLYASAEGAAVVPNREALPTGRVRLYHVTEAELAALAGG